MGRRHVSPRQGIHRCPWFSKRPLVLRAPATLPHRRQFGKHSEHMYLNFARQRGCRVSDMDQIWSPVILYADITGSVGADGSQRSGVHVPARSGNHKSEHSSLCLGSGGNRNVGLSVFADCLFESALEQKWTKTSAHFSTPKIKTTEPLKSNPRENAFAQDIHNRLKASEGMRGKKTTKQKRKGAKEREKERERERERESV